MRLRLASTVTFFSCTKVQQVDLLEVHALLFLFFATLRVLSSQGGWQKRVALGPLAVRLFLAPYNVLLLLLAILLSRLITARGLLTLAHGLRIRRERRTGASGRLLAPFAMIALFCVVRRANAVFLTAGRVLDRSLLLLWWRFALLLTASRSARSYSDVLSA